jgi:hypothetical protein
MSVRAAKFAPIAAVAGVLGYLAWPYLDEPAGMRNAKDAPKPPELAQSQLSPAPTPPPDRNPFATPESDKPVAAADGSDEHAVPARGRAGGIGDAPVAKAGGIGDSPRPKGGGIGGDGPKRGGIGESSRPRAGGIGESRVARKGGIGESAPRASSTLPSDPAAFILNGTFVCRNGRSAVINGELYEEGQKIVPEGSALTVSIVHVEIDEVTLDVDGKPVILKYPDRLTKPAADPKSPALVRESPPPAPARALTGQPADAAGPAAPPPAAEAPLESPPPGSPADAPIPSAEAPHQPSRRKS